MLSGLFLMVSLFFGSFRVGARYMGDWLRSIAILLALGGFLVLIFTPVL